MFFLTIAFFFWGAIWRSSRTLAVQRPLVGVLCPAERDKASGEACSSSTSSSFRSPAPSACSRRSYRTVAVRRQSNGTGLRGVVFYIYVQVSAILDALCAQSALLKETSATFRSLAHARSASGHPCRYFRTGRSSIEYVSPFSFLFGAQDLDFVS